MQWFIISRDMHVLCNPSTELEKSLPIDDSGSDLGQEITLVNNIATGIYDFITDPNHPDFVHITEGNYVSFVDKYGKHRLYTIMAIEGESEWKVHCEDIGLDLINEDADVWDWSNNPQTIEKNLERVLFDTGWEIGINEIPTRKAATMYDNMTDSQLSRLGMLLQDFDAECDFEIVMQGSKVVKQVVNIYQEIGQDRVQQRFIDDINLISLRRDSSIEDLCTCLRCYGNKRENSEERLTIADLEYDDGRYYSPKGHMRIYDREARNKWSRYRAYNYEGQSEFDGYINGTFEYDTDSAKELLDQGLMELKSRSEKKVAYEATLYDLRADIGDTVQIADNRNLEKVYLSARVQSVRNHYTVTAQDTGVLANYQILAPNPTTALQEMLEELKKQIVVIDDTEIRYQVGTSGTLPPDGKWLDYIPELESGQFLWTQNQWNYTNHTSDKSYSVSKSGEDGIGISSTSISYIISQSGTDTPADSAAWRPVIPTVPNGFYLWTRTLTTYSDGKQTKAYSVSRNGNSNMIVSPEEPENPDKGQLWQKADGEVIYRWDGSRWAIHHFTADNITVDELSALNSNIGTIKAGVIQSYHYEKDKAGLKIDLDEEYIDSKNFKLKNTGSIIGGWNIGENGLYNDNIGFKSGKAGFLSHPGSGIVFYVDDKKSYKDIINIMEAGLDFFPNACISTDGDIYAKKVFTEGEMQAKKIEVGNIDLLEGMSYSGSEVITPEKWFGKPVYRKVVNIGSISSANQTQAHYASNVGTIWIDTSNSFLVASNGNTYALPRVQEGTISSGAEVRSQVTAAVNKTNIMIFCGSNANFENCYVTIKYTKTTD